MPEHTICPGVAGAHLRSVAGTGQTLPADSPKREMLHCFGRRRLQSMLLGRNPHGEKRTGFISAPFHTSSLIALAVQTELPDTPQGTKKKGKKKT